jgi:hypothetical protein
MGRNDPVYEHVFQFPHGLQFGPQPIAQLPQGCFVFSREKNLFRKETVLYGVEVLFSAFCRLASAFLSLVIDFASPWFYR